MDVSLPKRVSRCIFQAIEILKFTFVNIGLPFLNGVMLGLGEICAHTFVHHLGWARGHTKIYSIAQRKYIQA
ncbi:TOM complex assembly protein Mim1 [Schizosaccharomyces japonicus yFS275]|uniref:TOM complex assembly protein Mim1 n=1 Tax=Schizosaccharomyces japonicus (strain yFS275 / FY16936) TaxID=402676 RepID=B6JW02_SCHJY|nr:TOM complex assembly protein Mim1 [Schizosaccharomyces japonicus yFS275]EEB05553.1 TOM complex assembly protein Mim1 [Schizosaccharomyces japonicus yFS275]